MTSPQVRHALIHHAPPGPLCKGPLVPTTARVGAFGLITLGMGSTPLCTFRMMSSACRYSEWSCILYFSRCGYPLICKMITKEYHIHNLPFCTLVLGSRCSPTDTQRTQAPIQGTASANTQLRPIRQSHRTRSIGSCSIQVAGTCTSDLSQNGAIIALAPSTQPRLQVHNKDRTVQC